MMTMGSLQGRVVVVTGAGQGLGREYAWYLAKEGARVVVNDLGVTLDGDDDARGAAATVAQELRDQGYEAVHNTDDVSDWEGARALIATAVDQFGGLDALVNNAGILRDKVLVQMSEQEWDDTIRVNLKGHFAPLRWAADYWRSEVKAGRTPSASVVNTSSRAGLRGNVGQTNYGSAKSAIATMTVIAARELERYGVRVNAVAPAARTRLTAATARLEEVVRAPEDPGAFDEWHPGNVAPLVAYLASTKSTETGQVFYAKGAFVDLYQGWTPVREVVSPTGRAWTVDQLADSVPGLVANEGAGDAAGIAGEVRHG